MSATTDELLSRIKALPEEDKLLLVDAILTDLYRPDSAIERLWADEARKRWEARLDKSWTRLNNVSNALKNEAKLSSKKHR